MLKKLNRREVSPKQREFAERAAYIDCCRNECMNEPLCHWPHADHYVEYWLMNDVILVFE